MNGKKKVIRKAVLGGLDYVKFLEPYDMFDLYYRQCAAIIQKQVAEHDVSLNFLTAATGLSHKRIEAFLTGDYQNFPIRHLQTLMYNLGIKPYLGFSTDNPAPLLQDQASRLMDFSFAEGDVVMWGMKVFGQHEPQLHLAKITRSIADKEIEIVILEGDLKDRVIRVKPSSLEILVDSPIKKM